MTVDEILNNLFWPIRTTIPKTSINEIETLVKFSLPIDYKKFLQTYSGYECHIGDQFVRLWDADELIEQNESYEIAVSLPLTIGIGSNGASEFIAIEMLSEGNYRIVLSPFIDIDKDYHIEIGGSFTEFLVRLHKKCEWFENT